MGEFPSNSTRELRMPRKKPKVYVAGPMRGLPGLNFPAFDAASEKLEALGYKVFNPAHEGGDTRAPYEQEDVDIREALARDVKFIAEEADFIYFLNGWERSYGARAEHALAVALDLGIFYQMKMEETPDAR